MLTGEIIKPGEGGPPERFVPRGRVAEHADRMDPDDRLSPEAVDLVRAGTPETTRATFESRWRTVLRFQSDTGREVLPMSVATCIELVAWMARECKGRRGRPVAPATIHLTLKTVAVVHNRAKRPELDDQGRALFGYVSPTKHPDVRKALKGYRAKYVAAGHRPDVAYPLTPEQLGAMVATLDLRTPIGVQDAVLLSVGYDMGARRGELPSLDVQDVEVSDAEVVVHLRQSKTSWDESGEGDLVVLAAHPPESAATCPVRTLRRWLGVLRQAGFTAGPLFRVVQHSGPPPKDGRPRKATITDRRLGSGRIELVIAQTSKAAGLHVDGRKQIVPHSLRSGSATAASVAGADVPEIAEHFRWAKGSPTPMRYIRPGRLRSRNPVRRVWERRPVVSG